LFDGNNFGNVTLRKTDARFRLPWREESVSGPDTSSEDSTGSHEKAEGDVQPEKPRLRLPKHGAGEQAPRQ
jgi:hypothetical protein